VPGRVGSKEWYEEFDRQKTNYALVGALRTFAPVALHGKQVLDVGCGPGFWARHLSRMGAVYTGIDISSRSAGLAKRSLEIFGLSGTVVNGNAESLPFEDESFDAVVSEGVIHHTPNTQACIDEIYRVLRPGGSAVVSVYYRLAILRSRSLFAVARPVMRTLGVVQAGRGREGIADAETPEAFVRMYDGLDNPIGKAYTRSELRSAFGRFRTVSTRRYFIPPVRPLVSFPAPLRIAISRMGLMIAVIVSK
jgi:SAM-dependent methyltransferase